MKPAWKTAAVYCLVVLTLLLCAKSGSKAVTALSESSPVTRKHCIVIDPGHGGEDGGAVSRSGLPESSFNLEISLRLNDLMNLLGYDTKMTRTADISTYTEGKTLSQKKVSDLKERVRIVNNTEGALLLSIHQNFYPDSQYSGAQVFYAKTEDSQQIARKLQAAFSTLLNKNINRSEKQSSGIYLMEHIRCPGVLIECGFLSNTAEETRLRDPEYQKKICSVIAATVCQHLSNT